MVESDLVVEIRGSHVVRRSWLIPVVADGCEFANEFVLEFFLDARQMDPGPFGTVRNPRW